MHQSPQKSIGGAPREKYATVAEDGETDRRAQRASPPRARRFERREEAPRGERARQHPRG